MGGSSPREVEEETGLVCSLGEEIGRTHYLIDERPKEVRYFHMSANGDAQAQNEIDAVRWVPLTEARRLLTYDRERQILDGAA